MKKVILTFALILAISSSLIAQPMRNGREHRQERPDPKGKQQQNNRQMEENRKKMEEEMNNRRMQMIQESIKFIAKKYGLTKEQTEKLLEIFKELMKNQAKLLDEMKKEMEALRQQHEKELKELLGEKFDEFKKEMDKLRNNPDPRRGGNRPARLTPEKVAELLKLSESQTKTYIELFDKTLKKFQKLRENSANGNVDRNKMYEKMKNIISEFEAELKKLLTKEQWQNYSKIKNDIFPMLGQTRRTERVIRFQLPDLNELIKELGLSETQTTDVKKLLANLAKDYQKLRQSIAKLEIKGNELSEKIKELMDGYEAELKKILTDEQFKKYQDFKKKAPQNQGNRGQNQGRMFGFERLIQTLELTEEQQKTVRQLFKEFTDASDKLRENRGNPEKMREQMQAMVNDLMKKIEAQLTEEQKKKFKELMDRLHENRRPDRPEDAPEGPDRPDRPERPGNQERPNRPESPAFPR